MSAGGTSERRRDERVDVEALEIRLLMEGIYARYGYDFRQYAFSSLRRRVRKALIDQGLSTVSALQERVLRSPEAMEDLLGVLSVSVTSMFRAPAFFSALRAHVAPALCASSFVRVWHAGCATGEEVYSLAIVLEEEGLYPRCRIYATDMNDRVLERARAGIVPLSAMREYTAAYHESGGRCDFSSYYRVDAGAAVLDPRLREHVVFANHNLTTDSSFNEFDVVLCRNVMIYFNEHLQERVRRLLHESLAPAGFLGLGEKETLRSSSLAPCYEEVARNQRLYRRIA